MIVKPGRSGTRLYAIWKGMKSRCLVKSDASYRFYGERGVTVCPDWRNFPRFLDWALANGYADDREIDRLDARGPYEPENCRWVLPILNRQRKELDPHGGYLNEMQGRLTEEEIAIVRPTGQAIRLFDGHGLYLQITPKGTRSWRFKYRIDDKEKLLTIGRYPKLSLQEARELHLVARGRLERGRDPAAMKAAIRSKSRSR